MSNMRWYGISGDAKKRAKFWNHATLFSARPQAVAHVANPIFWSRPNVPKIYVIPTKLCVWPFTQNWLNHTAIFKLSISEL